MGVQSLWELLAPVGRRVSVETLAGKRLAIDASIWMVQFMKAMRDEKGEMVRNAHVLGFFRRICKLLYLRTKPVFVFDGGTPALKRRTVIARRRQRENAQAKIRKTAEKLLLNQLKAMRLKELAKGLENQRQKRQQKNDGNAAKLSSNESVHTGMGGGAERLSMASSGRDLENLEEALASSIVAENKGRATEDASTSAAAAPLEEVEGDEDEQMILPRGSEDIDPDVFAALPPSIQLELIDQMNGPKRKRILSNDQDHINMSGCSGQRNKTGSVNNDWQKLDEMLAASIAAEENGDITNKTSTSGPAILSEEENSDEDEELLLPVMHGNVEPAVLAALPPSMQLDLLGQMRESLMAENRQKYQKVKKAPDKFSELQIESYLKTVAFRREIDEVQKAAAGRGFGGVQTSRIASEANREFIFSSSFTGDKQVLASARVEGIAEKNENTPSRHHNLNSSCGNTAISKSNSVLGSIIDESRRALSSDVETYLDERGQVRVSRLRAMGIRMTRDLQRNLDLMKEINQEKTTANKVENLEPMSNREKTESPKSFSSDYLVAETSLDVDGEPVNMDVGNDVSMVTNGTSIEITFEDDGEGTSFANDDDDEIFARLVAEVPLKIPADGTRKQSSHIHSDSDSDCEWEEMHIEEKGNSSANNVNSGMKPSIESNLIDESDVEWEETPCNAVKTAVCTGVLGKSGSKGCLEEEADLEEAIRRSLLDLGDEKSNNVLPEPKNSNELGNFLDKEDIMVGPDLTHQNGSLQQESPVGHNFNDTGVSTNKPLNRSEKSGQAAGEEGNLNREMLNAKSETLSEVKKVRFLLDQCADAYNSNFGSSTVAKRSSKDISHKCDLVSSGMADAILADKRNASQADQSVLVSDKKANIETESSTSMSGKENNLEPELYQYLTDMTGPSNSLAESAGDNTAYDVSMEQIAAGSSHEKDFAETEKSISRSAIKDNENRQVEFTEASLEEEMLALDQESRDLGEEQRRLERNAESVTSEMFAECQELLQIFGLPYIIAPMEAEAQCAYMELANLVDGVVTDDSDAFLFGAESVYKNIFNERKYVETYFMKDIEKELGLTREKLIRMALLLGSDYTEGVSGIGIVNAIEVVNAFAEEDGLQKFREWIESPDPTILGSFNGHARANVKKIGSKVGNNDFKSGTEGVDASQQKISQADENQQSADDIQDMKQIFIEKHRTVSKNWHIPPSFPSEAVITAYSCPQVDKSTEPFSWGKPDILVLQKLCWEKFGWNSLKTDELLLPVLKEYEKRETQLRLEAFYSFNERFAKIRSKRIKKAVKGITGTQALELMDDSKQEVPGAKKKRKISSVENGDNKMEKLQDGNGEKLNSIETSTTKQSRKRGVHRKNVSSEVRDPEPVLPTGQKQKTAKKSHRNREGRGRGRGYGIGKKGKGSLNFDLSETSSSDCHSGDHWQEVCSENLKQAQEVRRSTRTRNPVNYNVDSLEVDCSGKSSSSKECHHKETAKQDMQEADNVHENVGPRPDGQKECEVVDAPMIESLCGDYLQSGGGFCMGESENGQQCVGQDVEPCFEDRFSDDYLIMGGGFCTGETETVKEKNDSEDPASVGENVESSTDFVLTGEHYKNFCSGESDSRFKRSLDEQETSRKKIDREVNLEHQTTCIKDNDPNVGVALQENVKNVSGTASVGALSAMPFLKRKRRKS